MLIHEHTSAVRQTRAKRVLFKRSTSSSRQMIKEFSSMATEFDYVCHPPVEQSEIRGIHSPKKNMPMPVDYPDAQLRGLPGNDTWSCFRRHCEERSDAAILCGSVARAILDCRGG